MAVDYNLILVPFIVCIPKRFMEQPKVEVGTVMQNQAIRVLLGWLAKPLEMFIVVAVVATMEVVIRTMLVLAAAALFLVILAVRRLVVMPL